MARNMPNTQKGESLETKIKIPVASVNNPENKVQPHPVIGLSKIAFTVRIAPAIISAIDNKLVRTTAVVTGVEKA